jgi:ABC-2 type transport system ATP-binding protein
MADKMIETAGLTRRFNDYQAVDGLDLEVGEGEVFGLLGPNGAGKTTTVRMLACLIRPTSGSAHVCGRNVWDPRDAHEIRKNVGMLTEASGFYDGLSVYKNLFFYSDLYHLSRQKAKANIDRYLNMFDMYGFRDACVGGFSKGMRQKLALIRCMVHEPRLLFLDEPTSGLDPESARTMRDFIRQLKQEGRTVLLCTHNLDDAERLCDRIAIIDKHILNVGTPQGLNHSAYGRKVVVKLERLDRPVLNTLSDLSAVRHLERKGDTLVIEVKDPESENADIINKIVQAGGRIQFVTELRHSLEDVYMKLLGDKVEH